MRALSVAGGVAQPGAGEGEDLVAGGADPVFGLPVPVPFNADAGVEGVMPGPGGSETLDVLAAWV